MSLRTSRIISYSLGVILWLSLYFWLIESSEPGKLVFVVFYVVSILLSVMGFAAVLMVRVSDLNPPPDFKVKLPPLWESLLNTVTSACMMILLFVFGHPYLALIGTAILVLNVVCAVEYRFLVNSWMKNEAP